MAQQIAGFLEKLTWKVTYYYALAVGLLPAPFNMQSHKFQHSRAYLFCSATIQLVFVGISPIGAFIQEENEEDLMYTDSKATIYWAMSLGKITRTLTLIALSMVTWMRRQQFIDLYESYRNFQNKYERFCRHFNMEKEMHDELNTVKYCSISKFVAAHCNAVIIPSLLLILQHHPNRGYLWMVFTNFLQNYFLLVANVEFFLILSRIHLHFVYINKCLEDMLLQQTPWKPLWLRRCWTLYRMHYECHQLSTSILRLARPITLFMLIKIFTTNITILYHAVQFRSGGIESDRTDRLVGLLTIGVFYWDIILTMISVDRILTSCNRTAEILTRLMDVPDVKSQPVQISRIVSPFHQYVVCHQLKFYIFGMFPLDKATCLGYFISAAVHMLVLMQFDLKSSS